METMKYVDANISPEVLRAVIEIGFEDMTPIQEQAIPVMLEGKDIIGQAQTGTGKTAAFGIPLVMKVNPKNRNTQAIVLCPTRELAIQAAEEIRRFAKYMHGIRVLPIYGGQEIYKQINALKGGVQIIVGTPGRVMDHMRRKTIRLNDVNMVVLDEADEMLDMGFREDMENILGEIKGEHQTALFSATMPEAILSITGTYQKSDAVMVKVVKEELTTTTITQNYYRVKKEYKDEVTARILNYYNLKKVLIFCNTKTKVDELAENLKKRGFAADGLHGDLSQHQRDVVMNRFRNGILDILIATDVAARGIDVDNVEAVINYDIPQDIEYYVHRIGRTGRAGRSGMSFTIVSGRESSKIREIEKICNTKLNEQKVPTVAAVTNAKAEKLLLEAAEFVAAGRAKADKGHLSEDGLFDNKIEKYKYLIEQFADKSDLDIAEIAAALLQSQIGEEGDEVGDVEEKPRKYERGGQRGGRGSYKGRKSEGRNYGRRNSKDDEKPRRKYERKSDKDDKPRKNGAKKDYDKKGAERRISEKKKATERKPVDKKPAEKRPVEMKTADKKAGTSGFRRERSSKS